MLVSCLTLSRPCSRTDAVEEARFRSDPDLMFDWEDVVQVEMMTTTPVQCSISLDSPPICPQITVGVRFGAAHFDAH